MVHEISIQGFERRYIRCRKLLIQICEAEGISILKGVVSSDHVHMHIEYAPKLNVSTIFKGFKGRNSHKLQQEFPKLKERYWGRHFWAGVYGARSMGNITDKILNNYLEYHRRSIFKDPIYSMRLDFLFWAYFILPSYIISNK